VEKQKPENVEKAPDLAKTESPSVDIDKKPETKEVSALPEPAFVGIDSVLSKVDKGMLEKAEALGIPIGALLVYEKSQENRVGMLERQIELIGKFIQEKMPTEDGIANKMVEKLKAEREKALANRPQPPQDQTQGQQQQKQEDGGEIKMLMKLLGLEGNDQMSSPVQAKINDLTVKLLDQAIDNVGKPSRFEQFFEDEIAKAKAKTMARALEEGAKP
jgi:hypothetical protein